MKIWTLQTHSPEIGSIYIASEEEALHYTALFSNQFYTKKVIRENWPDTLIYNLPDADFSKFFFAGKEFWICSEKARLFISPLVQKKVEFLPLIHRKKARKKISYTKQLFRRKAYKPVLEMIPTEPHYILNILDLQSLDVIDTEESELRYNDENGIIYRVTKLAFKPAKIQDAHLFKIDYPNPYFQSAAFISDEFKTIIAQNNLKGLTFFAEPEDSRVNLIWKSKP